MRCVPGFPLSVTPLLSLLLPVFAVFVASFPVFSAVCSAATSRLLLRRFVSPASSGFAAPLRFSDCVAPSRLFGHYSVFVFGALRPPSRRAAGAIHAACAQLTPYFVWGELREKRAVARNFASLGGIRVRDQGCEFGQDCRSDRLAGGLRDRVLVEATV